VTNAGVKVDGFSVSCERPERAAEKGVTGTVASDELRRKDVTGVAVRMHAHRDEK
jgi:hypothetical protein